MLDYSVYYTSWLPQLFQNNDHKQHKFYYTKSQILHFHVKKIEIRQPY